MNKTKECRHKSPLPKLKFKSPAAGRAFRVFAIALDKVHGVLSTPFVVFIFAIFIFKAVDQMSIDLLYFSQATISPVRTCVPYSTIGFIFPAPEGNSENRRLQAFRLALL